jgi:hypothetical protein
MLLTILSLAFCVCFQDFIGDVVTFDCLAYACVLLLLLYVIIIIVVFDIIYVDRECIWDIFGWWGGSNILHQKKQEGEKVRNNKKKKTINKNNK